MPAHSPAGRGFAPLRLSPARIRKGRFLLYPAQHSPVTIRTRLSPSMLRPFDPFRETMHDTTGLSPYIETDFRYGRKPVSISSEGICLPHPKFSLPSHSVANRRKNGLSMNTDSPNVQRGPVRSIDVEPLHASGNFSSTDAFPSLRSNVIGVQSEAVGNESPGIDPPAIILRKSSTVPPFSHLYSKER